MLSIEESRLLDGLAAFLLPFFRVLGIFTAAPILSARAFPVRIRVAVALLISIVAAPLAPRTASSASMLCGGTRPGPNDSSLTAKPPGAAARRARPTDDRNRDFELQEGIAF